ncbi:GntR family transcriptional regulator [Ulvibacterium sp.]|uniref:GntR family transcriptional regulator n=1 Tax=Ulvibacterium sp. TaxID=2665914 RepID=UPI00262B4CE9|nr:GntR family transcriptional regulator [Ulvibacterium sp.]
MDIYQHIKINGDSRVPKYRQIVDSIVNNISEGHLKVGQKIPSINNFSEEFYLSRHTVEKAYKILKDQKIISSTRGKGYYITRTDLVSKINILFLINKLSSYKMLIYNSFIEGLGSGAHTDLHIYHCDVGLFLNLFEKHFGGYDYYVVMPHFKTETLLHISSPPKVVNALKKIPDDKLVVLDNNKLEMPGAAIQIFQDFERDIYEALKQGLPKILNYRKLILIYPSKSVYPYPKRILHGFRKFCVENAIDFEIIEELFDDIILKKGDLFITIEEADLVNLMKRIRDMDMKLGNDIGIISYNDTPLKELLGITVISTKFEAMGKTAAKMILKRETGRIKNPFSFIDRNSH